MAIDNKTRDVAIAKNVHVAISAAVALSIMLILAGIWNAQRTADSAAANIKTSIEAQQLSNALRSNQDAMTNAIEFAMSSGDAQWRTSYENSLKNLQEVVYSTSLTIDDPIIDTIQQKLNIVVVMERELFKKIASNEIDLAFDLLSSDNYQEQKIEQEQLAFTLRAILDKKSNDLIAALKLRLKHTIFALICQIVLIAIIWNYVIRVFRNWHNSQSRHSEELSKLAHYDTLTGIGNRALFQIRLEIAFREARRDGKSVGLLLMDIDHFKDINDSLGHDIGDELLVYVAGEIQRCCRDIDTVARLGGDEFAIITCNLDEKRDTALLGQKILSIFEQPIRIKNHEIKTGTSIGFAFYPEDAESGEELLRKADMALYEAKRNGRAHCQYFDKRIETKARRKVEVQEDLMYALEHDQFALNYQPIVDLDTGDIIGVECLLRWYHPERGLVSPDAFIDIAEESRLIIPIGEWVLENACAQQVEWVKQGLPELNMAVNLSAVQFGERELHNRVADIIKQTGIKRDFLTLEITESTLMKTEGDLIQRLYELNSLGLSLAIDDFGTGYSSLAYLKRFPIHHLKIDREFIKDIPHNQHDIAISRSIIKMAHELGIMVVAEGIEEVEQHDFLKDARCNFGQGYLFGKPVPAEDIEKKLQHRMKESNVTRFAAR